MTNGLVFRYNRRSALARRAFDVVAASLALALSAPVVGLACIAIVLEDGRSPFYTQRRVGRFERTFTIYKLRTMYAGDCKPAQKPREGRDPRITNVGRVLRRLSIDELPQFINVLRGDMSLVGPRPEMHHIVRRYHVWQHARHLMLPGLTCIWQTEARGRYPLDSPEATLLDLQYIRSASSATDAKIIARTFGSVIFGRGAV